MLMMHKVIHWKCITRGNAEDMQPNAGQQRKRFSKEKRGVIHGAEESFLTRVDDWQV